MPFPVTAEQIRQLGIARFRALLNRLLSIEANSAGVPLTDLWLTELENVADGGADGIVRWPHGQNNPLLGRGETVVQLKTGSLTEAKLKEEISKPAVSEVLTAGGSYRLFLATDLTATKQKAFAKLLKDHCRRKRHRADAARIVFAQQIATWAQRHPAAVASITGLPAFTTVQQWEALPAMSNPWVAVPDRQEVIEALRVFLADGAPATRTIRIEGQAGIGKTRVVLEAFKSKAWAAEAVYAGNAEAPEVRAILKTAATDPSVKATIVTDECDRDQQQALSWLVDLANGRVKLICIGRAGAPIRREADPACFQLSEMTADEVRRAVELESPHTPPEFVRTAVRLAGSGKTANVKLAFFVIAVFQRVPGLSPAEISAVPNISEFLKRFTKEPTRRALDALSIFGRIGWRDELRPEAEAVGVFFSIPFADLQDGVHALRSYGVVAEQGRYIYVTPELLADQVAADLWRRRGRDLLDLLPQLPSLEPRKEMLRRMAILSQEPEVGKAVEALLAEDRLFRAISDLEDQERSELFRVLASAAPLAATDVLERLVGPAPAEDLERFKLGRRNVIFAIETLLRWPEASLKAARALRALALAENEAWANNATGIFNEFFHLFLSRCPLPFADRLVLADELIQRGDPQSRRLASTALSAAAALHVTRTGGNTDEYSGLPLPEEWRPRTYAEMAECLQSSASRLRLLVGDPGGPGEEAWDGLLDHIFALTQCGAHGEALRLAQGLVPSSDGQRKQLIECCQRLAGDEKIRQPEREGFAVLSDAIYDKSYAGRLHRWLGDRPHTDYDLNTGFQRADENARDLADEALANGIPDPELEWLSSREAVNVWQFGKRLGEDPRGEALLERIVVAAPDDENALLLSSFLAGMRARLEPGAWETNLDAIAAKRPKLGFVCTWRNDPSAPGSERMLRLVNDGRVPAERLALLRFGKWVTAMTPPDIERAISALLSCESVDLAGPALEILDQKLSAELNALEGLREVAWRLMDVRVAGRSHMDGWHWGRIAKRLAARDPARAAEAIVRALSDPDYFAVPNDPVQEALEAALGADPAGTWAVVSRSLLSDDPAGIYLTGHLSENLAERFPTQVLVDWARQNAPKGPLRLVRILNVDGSPMPERVRALLLAFPGDKALWHAVLARLESGAWAGPMSGWLESRLRILEGWSSDADPQIRESAASAARLLRREVHHQKQLEEERGF